MRRPRHLSAEERALWDSVAKQAKPLKKTRRKAVVSVPPTPDPLSASSRRGPPREERVGGGETQAPRISPPPALAVGRGRGWGVEKGSSLGPAVQTKPNAGIERREKSRLARGAREIDARLDLHGMTQARAHRALLAFLRRAQADGCRYVLIITGKGKVSAEASERGVLRRRVPEWFALAEFRVLVTGYEEAAIGHGGAGALYVRVRRG